MFTVRRSQENPILSPQSEQSWEGVATFNPSVVGKPGALSMYYRAESNPDPLSSPHTVRSTIGRALSEDGVHFHSREQVLVPSETWDAYGCEDPRVTVFEGVTYLTYTALGGYPFNADNIKVGIAVSHDGVSFTDKHLVTPFNAKAFTIFPERVQGKVAALMTIHTDQPPAAVVLVLAERIESFWSPQFWISWYASWQQHELALKRTEFDHIEVGAPPVLTDKGWLFFYSYIENYFGGGQRVFGVEAALLDKDDPQKILGRSYPLLVPEEAYERYGTVPNIVFPTSANIEGNTVDLYYGAADTVCAKATMHLDDLLRHLDPQDASRTFIRGADNPTLTPRGSGFESRAVFNAGAVDLGDSVHILYRAMSADNTSTMGYARSADGIHIDERLDAPAYAPRADFESKRGKPDGNSGCEDPRLTVINDRVHVTYTAYDGVNSPRGAASSISVDDFLAKDFTKWTSPVLITPDGIDDKDIGLLPEMVEGKYVLYHRINGRICADMIHDLTFQKPVSRCIEIMGPREGMWDGAKVGIAGPPIKVPGGWLLIYHGVSHHSFYRLGAALLDATGLVVLSRTADPIFEAVEAYEKVGEVGNVVFSCGAVVRDDTVYLYYGGGDKVLGVATASLSHILKSLS
jgi:beta-1,2-mannobiose phosphorylase / 1,2-beta-oligomannan phosphorylase